MALIEVMKRRLSRVKAKRKDLEVIIDSKAATSSQKQQYIECKAKEDELESLIDLGEGLLQEDQD